VKNTEDLKNIAGAFDALADATGGTANDLANQLIPAFRTFGLELPTSAAALDKFTWLVKNTRVDLTDFSSAMTYVSMYGKDLNITMDDMVAIMAALSAGGKESSTVTRIFRSAVTEAANGTTDFNTALGLTQEEIDKYKGQLDSASGSTEKYAAQANRQFGVMDNLKAMFSKITLEVGSMLEPLQSVMIAMSALGGISTFLGTSIGQSAAQFVIHTGAVVAHSAVLVAHKIALAAHAIAIGVVTAAQWLWNAAMAANPIGIVILAIGLLIAAIVLIAQNWDMVREKTIEVWNTITTWLSGVWNTIISFFQSNWDKILAILFPAVGLPLLIARNWGPIVDFVSDLWNTVTSIVSGWWSSISAVIGSWAPVQVLSSGWNAIIGFFSGLWDSVTNTIQSWWSSLVSFLAGLNPWNYIKGAWEGLRDGIKGVLDQIFGHSDVETWAGGLKSYLSGYDLGGAGKSMMNSFGSAVDSSLNSVSGKVSSFVSNMQSQIQSLLNQGYKLNAQGGYISPQQQQNEAERAEINGVIGSQGYGAAVATYGQAAVDYAVDPLNSGSARDRQVEEAWSNSGGQAGLQEALDYMDAVDSPYYAEGGILKVPTLLSRLGGQRMGIAGEAGPEAIVPLDKMGYKTANIYIQVDGKTLAEAMGQPLVDLIRLKTGVR